MNKQTVQFIISKLFGTLLRHGLSALGAYLAAQGMGTLDEHSQSNILEVLMGALAMLISFGWSFARSHLSEMKSQELQKLAQGFGVLQQSASPKPLGKAGEGLLPPISCILAALMIGSLCSCAIISKFDQNSLDTTKKLKYETDQLIVHASEDPSAYQDQITSLQKDLATEKAYESGKGKQNIATQKQWDILTSDQQLLGRLLREWSAGKHHSVAFVTEETAIIDDVFNQIVELEGAKTK